MSNTKNTLVDKLRCYELWTLVAQSCKLSDGDILEVGVWRGGTGALIAKHIIDWICEKLLPVGIIVYDDYGFESCLGITKQVEEQILLEDLIILHNINGQAIIKRLICQHFIGQKIFNLTNHFQT